MRPPRNDGPHGAVARSCLGREGFDRTWDAEGVPSLAPVIPPGDRCGIYVLAFEGGDWYVGQAVDVARRFLSHRRAHPDIARIYFKRVESTDLNAEELRLISLVETTWGWPLRNLRGSSLPKGALELHELVPADLLDRWAEDPALDIDIGAVKDLDDLHRKSEPRSSTLAASEHAADVSRILKLYLTKTIPAALDTELDFWSLSCLAGGGTAALARVNLHWQEVLVLYEGPKGLAAAFQVTRSVLERPLLKWLLLRLRHHPVRIRRHAYQTGGADQLRVEVQRADAILGLLADPHFLRAARYLNSRLMLKGRVNPGLSASHCVAMVRTLRLDQG